MTTIEVYGYSIDLQPRTLLLTGLAGVAIYVVYKSRRPRGMPPGPMRIPLVGSPALMRSPDIFLARLHECRQKYGDIFVSYVGPIPLVVLTTYSLMKEAFVTKGTDTSGRPLQAQRAAVFPNYPHIQGILDTSLNDEWKKQRNISLTILRGQGWGKGSIEERIVRESEFLIKELEGMRGSPTDPHELLGVAISNIMCSMLFGRRYDYADKEFASLLRDIDGYFIGSGGLTNLMDVPVLKWLPMVRRAVKEMYRHGSNLISFYERKIAEAQHKLDSGEEPSDFVTNYLEEVNKMKEGNATISQDWLLPVIHDFFIAGSETTATTLRWAMLYMAKFPEVQNKVHKEIDSVFGRGRHQFSLKDREQLPYTDATIMEIQRMSAMVVGSLPHMVSEDIKLAGYNIPKGSVICGLMIEVLHDPKVWGDPEVFRPERFIGEDGKVFRPEEWIPFSMGRRTCLGEQLARQELFLFFSHVMNCFTISPPEDGPELTIKGILQFVLKPVPDQPLCFKARKSVKD